jgi:ketosteroid isomerase-like protein
MTNEDETRRAVLGYFRAWTTKDVAAAYALLADDLEFVGPTARYASAAEFKPALEGFAKMTKSSKMTDLLVVGDRAAMAYDCELPPPVGLVRIASFFQVQNGKIRRYETMFDVTELRKLLAAKA